MQAAGYVDCINKPLDTIRKFGHNEAVSGNMPLRAGICLRTGMDVVKEAAI